MGEIQELNQGREESKTPFPNAPIKTGEVALNSPMPCLLWPNEILHCPKRKQHLCIWVQTRHSFGGNLKIQQMEGCWHFLRCMASKVQAPFIKTSTADSIKSPNKVRHLPERNATYFPQELLHLHSHCFKHPVLARSIQERCCVRAERRERRRRRRREALL